jgi:hypothetical protein
MNAPPPRGKAALTPQIWPGLLLTACSCREGAEEDENRLEQ